MDSTICMPVSQSNGLPARLSLSTILSWSPSTNMYARGPENTKMVESRSHAHLHLAETCQISVRIRVSLPAINRGYAQCDASKTCLESVSPAAVSWAPQPPLLVPLSYGMFRARQLAMCPCPCIWVLDGAHQAFILGQQLASRMQ